ILTLLVIDPASGAALARCWIGGARTIEHARRVLGRAPDYRAIGFDSWGRLTGDEASAIAREHYANGADPKLIERLAAIHDPQRCWWILEHDY
ncbi:MAG: hypothetical protein AB7P00_43165, partial [Sandaracinaceae bacterium]